MAGPIAFASDGFAPVLLPALEALSEIDPSIVLTDERTPTETSENPE